MVLYYAFHTFINSVKKLFKTWLAFFLIIFVIGFGIGFGLDKLIPEDTTPDEGGEEIVIDEGEPLVDPVYWAEVKNDALEGIAGVVVILGLCLICFGADKKGSNIFQPADVNLLFTSPRKPQSILLFRMVGRIFAIIFAGTYVIAINVIGNLEPTSIGVWTPVGVLLAWVMLLVYGELIQVLIYTVCSTKNYLKKYVSPLLTAVLALIALEYILRAYFSGDGIIATGLKIFCFEGSRYIPVYGWIKGIFGAAISADLKGVLMYSGISIVGAVLLGIGIWHIKADFYEEALSKTEELATIMADAQAGGIVKRQKDRSEKLERDGYRYGSGENVFFFKAMYNRFRFAKFKIFTTTSIIYLIVGAAVTAMVRFLFESYTILPTVLVLCGMAFYRTLGNPLSQDVGVSLFVTIPGRMKKKFFYSMIGGTANCVLDLLPAMILMTIMMKANLLEVLGWILFTATLDFYSTSVGSFLNISTSLSAGKIMKQILTIMFVYFGLIPDAGILLGFGLGLKNALGDYAIGIGCLIAAVINLAIGYLFCILASHAIEPDNIPILGKTYNYNEKM